MTVWRQRHIAPSNKTGTRSDSSPLHIPTLHPSLPQLNVCKLSEWKFKALLTYNIHESLGIYRLFLLDGVF